MINILVYNTYTYMLLKKPFSFHEINPLIDDRLNKGFGNL